VRVSFASKRRSKDSIFPASGTFDSNASQEIIAFKFASQDGYLKTLSPSK